MPALPLPFLRQLRTKGAKKKTDERCLLFVGVWRCHPDLNRGMKVLQTFALPLGYGTI